MSVYFMGDSHAPSIFREACQQKGIGLALEPEQANLIFVAQDTPTDMHGNRDLAPIEKLIEVAVSFGAPVVISSQVPPGFTRSLNIPDIYCMAETLRIKDALERAIRPEMFIIGAGEPAKALPQSLLGYLMCFPSRTFICTWEEAEFAKMAINLTLASQVNNAVRLNACASRIGNINWSMIESILHTDSRIGPFAYLRPGDWRDSPHLLREWVTYSQIMGLEDEDGTGIC